MGKRICPDCGAHLDPEEKCDCQEERQEKGPRQQAIGAKSKLPDSIIKGL